MATEKIFINGTEIITLKELIGPGLRAVFVGLNPAPDSVKAEHYYQGRLGQRFWNRLSEYEITPHLLKGAEDEEAFSKCKFGFADLIRCPTKSAQQLSKTEKRLAAPDLVNRLTQTCDFPFIIFTFKDPFVFAGPDLSKLGYRLLRMPPPFASRDEVDRMMNEIQNALGKCH